MKQRKFRTHELLAWLGIMGFVFAPYAAAETSPPAKPGTTAVAPAPENAPSDSEAASAGQKLTAQELDQLVAPIALYPDVLVAQILTAATNPLDVVEASRFLEKNDDPALIDEQKWDPSVIALAHYPQVLARLNEDLGWTRTLGRAVIDQRQDVMDAIQRMRREAEAAGALKTTPQQVVQQEGPDIIIEPANPQVIYVPEYHPTVTYYGTGGYWYWPEVVFGPVYWTGPWLDLDFDWHRHFLYFGTWDFHHGFIRDDRDRFFGRFGHGFDRGRRAADFSGRDVHWRPSSDSRRNFGMWTSSGDFARTFRGPSQPSASTTRFGGNFARGGSGNATGFSGGRAAARIPEGTWTRPAPSFNRAGFGQSFNRAGVGQSVNRAGFGQQIALPGNTGTAPAQSFMNRNATIPRASTNGFRDGGWNIGHGNFGVPRGNAQAGRSADLQGRSFSGFRGFSGSLSRGGSFNGGGTSFPGGGFASRGGGGFQGGSVSGFRGGGGGFHGGGGGGGFHGGRH